jgi:hypothetical protein
VSPKTDEGTARRSQRPFVLLWTVAVAATVAAFVLHLALRGRTVDLGYRLGRVRAEQARLREVKRVLSLEAASYETPQRVELVARTLLGMSPPPPERVVPLRAPVPTPAPEDEKPPRSEAIVIPTASASAAAPGGDPDAGAGAVEGDGK